MNLHQIGLVTDRQALLPAALDIGNGTIRIFVGFLWPIVLPIYIVGLIINRIKEA